MAKGQIRRVTKEEFLAHAKSKVDALHKSGRLLDGTATILERAQDFSTALLDSVRESREKAQLAVDELKDLEENMLIRGRTFASEQYDATMAHIKK